MNIIKRDGREVPFDRTRMFKAIDSASQEVAEVNPKGALTPKEINSIITTLYNRYYAHHHAVNVEDIQDDIETALMKAGKYEVAKQYIKYRRDKEILRKTNTTDASILSMLSLENETIKQENSNKNPTLISTQRDYMAGEVSRDIVKRYLMPQDVMEAHEQGLIHVHE